jgi:CHAD domain-containing protein
MAAVLRHLLATLDANVAGTLRDVDTEFLHDLRVAVRRTRTALKLGAAVLPAGLAERYRVEFKWLGDVTTPTRDLDVYLLNYPAMLATLVAATPRDLAPFHDHLRRRRATERRRLVRALRSARFTALTASWQAALDSLRVRRATLDAAQLASGTIRRAHQRVLSDGRAITPASPPEALHDLRKRCKELRYALEFFTALCDPAGYRRAVRDLKGLQECLGTYQDCDVQQQELRVMAAQLAGSPDVPVTTLLALGELMGQLARRSQLARGDFAHRFAGFAGPASLAAFRGLVAGGQA